VALAQPQQTCRPVNISIGAQSFNVARLTVTTTPVDLTLGRDTSGTNALGTLVCNILTTSLFYSILRYSLQLQQAEY